MDEMWKAQAALVTLDAWESAANAAVVAQTVGQVPVFPDGFGDLTEQIEAYCHGETRINPGPFVEFKNVLWRVSTGTPLNGNRGQSPDNLQTSFTAVSRDVCLPLRIVLGQRAKQTDPPPPPKDDQLVTIAQIAKMVHRDAKTVRNRYRKGWPKPVIAAAGQRPSQWWYHDLKPVLREQFPNMQLPEVVS